MTATTRNDTPVAIEGGGAEFRMRGVGGGMAFVFVWLPQGADMARLSGDAGRAVPVPPQGYLLKGRLEDSDSVRRQGL